MTLTFLITSIIAFIHFTMCASESGTSGGIITRDYCQSETMDLACAPGHVILVHVAEYGRMKGGRCVSDSFGYAIRCHTDVTDHVSQPCAGRESCSMFVGTLDTVVQPCPKDFKSYLQVNYSCLFVARASSCDGVIHTVSEHSLDRGDYLLPWSSHDNSCPVSINAAPGQQVVVKLQQLAASKDEQRLRAQLCPCLVRIQDGDQQHDLDLCQYSGQRVTSLLTSRSPTVTVSLAKVSNAIPSSYLPFLLTYNVTGCEDVIPPAGAYMKRTSDNTAAVVCNDSEETWYITCKDDRWIGEPGNCTLTTAHHGILKKHTNWKTAEDIPHGIFLTTALGVLIGIIVGSLMLLTVVLIRRRGRCTSEPEAAASQSAPAERHYESCLRPHDFSMQLTDDKMTSLRDYSTSWRGVVTNEVMSPSQHRLYCDTAIMSPYERSITACPQCVSASSRVTSPGTPTATVMARGQTLTSGQYYLINPIKQPQLPS